MNSIPELNTFVRSNRKRSPDKAGRIGARLGLSPALWLLLLCAGCTTSSAGPQTTWGGGSEADWSSKDLLAGPTAIVKAPFSVISCPFRLTGKAAGGISMSRDGTGNAIGEAFLLPIRALVDGVFTGAGYLGGGVIDTVSGGAFRVVGEATGEEEPNGTIHCALAGTSDTN